MDDGSLGYIEGIKKKKGISFELSMVTQKTYVLSSIFLSIPPILTPPFSPPHNSSPHLRYPGLRR